MLHNQLLRPLIKNSALMAISGVVSAVVLILSVPVVVAHLGTEGYGVWECLLAVSTTAIVFQTAINGTLVWRISLNCGAGNHADSLKLVRIAVGTTLLVLTLLAPWVWFYRQTVLNILQVPHQWYREADWMLTPVVSLILLGGINQALLALVAGYQRAGLAAMIQSLGLAVTHLTGVGIILAGGGLSALLYGMIAGFAVTLMASYAAATSVCRGISLRPVWPSWTDVRILAPYAALLLLSNLTLVFRDNIDRLLLASLDSPVATGSFAMAQKCSSILMQLGWTVCLPLTAMVGSLHAAQNRAAIQRLYKHVSTWMAASTGLICVGICTLRDPLFVLWLGRSQPQAYGYLILLLLGVTAALALTGVGVSLAKGLGRPGLETRYLIVTLLMILVTKPLLIHLFGATGCVVSSTISWIVGSAYFLFALHREIQLPRETLVRSSGILAMTAVLSAVSWTLTAQYPLAAHNRWEASLVIVRTGIPLAAGYLMLLWVLRFIPAPTRILAAIRQPRAAGGEVRA